jgi:hypothetical protein
MDEGSAIVAASEAVIESSAAEPKLSDASGADVSTKQQPKGKKAAANDSKKRKLKDRQGLAAKKRLRKQEDAVASVEASVAKRASCLGTRSWCVCGCF